MSHPIITSTHPHTKILSDCLTIVFSYHIQHISHDFAQYSDEDLLFFRKRVVCWDFHRNVDIREFLKRCRNPWSRLQYVCARSNNHLDNETFKQFRGVNELDVGCNGSIGSTKTMNMVTDEALENLRGIETLDLTNHYHISSNAFVNLRGVRNLTIRGMHHLENSTLEHLRGIQKLDIGGCSNITDAGMANLRGIQSLDITACTGITGACFNNLRGIKVLKMGWCKNISGEALKNLIGIQELDLHSCDQIRDEHLKYLVGVKVLNASCCWGITFPGLKPLRGIRKIILSYISPEMDGSELQSYLRRTERYFAIFREAEVVTISLLVTRALLSNLRRAKHICFNRVEITADTRFVEHLFNDLVNVEMLELKGALGECVTDKSFKNLPRLRTLVFKRNYRHNLTKCMFQNLPESLEHLDCRDLKIQLHAKDVKAAARSLSRLSNLIVPGGDRVWQMVLKECQLM